MVFKKKHTSDWAKEGRPKEIQNWTAEFWEILGKIQLTNQIRIWRVWEGNAKDQ